VMMALTVLVGVSRVFLGGDYPTDVLAGWTGGGVWGRLWGLGARVLQRRGAVEKNHG
jgi:undecaprenyl-diphosphatase